MTEQQFEILKEYMERFIAELQKTNEALNEIRNWTNINGDIPVTIK